MLHTNSTRIHVVMSGKWDYFKSIVCLQYACLVTGIVLQVETEKSSVCVSAESGESKGNVRMVFYLGVCCREKTERNVFFNFSKRHPFQSCCNSIQL